MRHAHAGAVEAIILQRGFTIGEWLIEPGDLRASRGVTEVREAIAAWHALFGDSSRRPRYVAASGRDGYSIIAPLGPRTREPIPERLMTAGVRRLDAPSPHRSIMDFANRLLAQLRRRRVVRAVARATGSSRPRRAR
jgi:hypothetical protein